MNVEEIAKFENKDFGISASIDKPALPSLQRRGKYRLICSDTDAKKTVMILYGNDLEIITSRAVEFCSGKRSS